MNNKLIQGIVVFALVLISFLLRLGLFGGGEYPQGWDAYYYIMKAHSLIELGEFKCFELSFVYPLFTGVSYLVGDYVEAYNLFVALLCGGFSLSMFFAGKNIGKSVYIGLLLCAFTVFSPTLTYVAAQFPKNLLALTFFVLFLGSLEKSKVLSGGTFILAFFTHRMTAALSFLGLMVKFFNRKNVRWIGVGLVGLLLFSLFFPGIIHINDLERFKGVFSITPHIAPISFIQLIGLDNVSALWGLELFLLYGLGIFFLVQFVFSKADGARTSFSKILFVLILLLGFPFLKITTGSMGYRFFLALILLLPLAIPYVLRTRSKKVWGSLTIGFVALAFLSISSYKTNFNAPYKLYSGVTKKVNDLLADKEVKLLITHAGLAEFLHQNTPFEGTNWNNEDPNIKPSNIWRITNGVKRSDFVKHLTDPDLALTMHITPMYFLVREDAWNRFYQKTIEAGDEQLLKLIRESNPVEDKPDFLKKGRAVSETSTAEIAPIAIGVIKLKKAYPDQILAISDTGLICMDGTFMRYDDGLIKTFDEALNNPDLEDQMNAIPYIKGKRPIPTINEDPGRIRYEPLFLKMYGNTEAEVKKHLVRIPWMPNTTNDSLWVTSVNDVHLRLQEISAALDTLSDELKIYAEKTAGVFNWRKIAGTERMSVHSFAIAIDINVKYSNYWRWESLNKDTIPYRNKIPFEIVQIFEDHGFIWGGKWYHYDTMHFEYRPELLIE